MTGLWHHRAGRPEPPASLRDVSYADGRMTWPSHRHHEPESRLAGYLDEAREILRRPIPAPDRAAADPAVGPDFETLRWFWLPEEVAAAADAARG